MDKHCCDLFCRPEMCGCGCEPCMNAKADEHNDFVSKWAPRTELESVRAALTTAEAALSDIGDATRCPGDDLSWCEKRAAEALPIVRSALSSDNPITQDDDWYAYEILPVALQLHMSHTGAADPLGYDEFHQLRDWLQRRVSGWVKSPEFCKQFDDAVRSVCEAALAETKNDWKKQSGHAVRK